MKGGGGAYSHVSYLTQTIPQTTCLPGETEHCCSHRRNYWLPMTNRAFFFSVNVAQKCGFLSYPDRNLAWSDHFLLLVNSYIADAFLSQSRYSNASPSQPSILPSSIMKSQRITSRTRPPPPPSTSWFTSCTTSSQIPFILCPITPTIRVQHVPFVSSSKNTHSNLLQNCCVRKTIISALLLPQFSTRCPTIYIQQAVRHRTSIPSLKIPFSAVVFAV